MKIKLKKILIPFILMLLFNLSVYSAFNLDYGAGMQPHIGIIFISGLLFGPYGAFGASIGNLICDIYKGYPLMIVLCSFIITFGVSFFSYKLWYAQTKTRKEVTKPKLNNTTNFIFFIAVLIVSASIYSILHQQIFFVFFKATSEFIYNLGFRYWLNFTNSSFIMGIIGIWLSKKIDFIHVPKKSERPLNKKLYYPIGCLLILSVIAVAMTNYLYDYNENIIMGETVLIVVLLYAYLTKPIVSEVKEINSHTISEGIMNNFLFITLIILIFAYMISGDFSLTKMVVDNLPIGIYENESDVMVFVDFLLLLFLIPSLGVLKYVEKKVIEPINKFSQIEGFIKEGSGLESKGLIETYAEYCQEDNEIGNLARSYTELIRYNNYYIENIKEIEGERERIKTELDIAERIQKSRLPTEIIDNENHLVYGYSKPAKEVGGDFFDYYSLDDENLAIVIGDASGKGIPAALLSAITQSLIKQKIKTTKDPSEILKTLNNQLCENNPEFMFITLWLGIYNEKTNRIRFSNAGHNPPLIKRNGTFEQLDIDKGIAIGVLENYEYTIEETDIGEGILLYTDGISDANNENKEFYGEDRLIEFLNNVKFDDKVINELLDNVNEFTNGEEQYDDMTLLALVNKNK